MTTTAPTAVPTDVPVTTSDPTGTMPYATATSGIPLTRLVWVELRKTFDTRSGLWLLASLGIAAVLTTGAIIAWAPVEQLTYSEFTMAIGVPMTIILPIIAVLSVTSEWSQRSGLATFTLVPHRSKVLVAKAMGAVLVTVPATAVAFGVGALGNLIGAALADVPVVWNQGTVDVAYFALGQTMLLLVGFVLGALIRNSSGAIVAYMIYGFVAPGLLAFLAFSQAWFADARAWVDPKYNQETLLAGDLAGEQWAQLATTTVVWLVVPMMVAVANVLRSEVK
ncbi:MAG: ABC transporter permease [Nocardioides sp.]